MAKKTYFKITGGKKLKGVIHPKGAKNGALQLLCAALLTKEKVVIRNVPEIIDIHKLITIIRNLGASVEHPSKGVYVIEAKDFDIDYLQTQEYKKLAGFIRGSIMLLAPLLNRITQIEIPSPGGDKIGRRRLDTHMNALVSLGVTCEYDNEKNTFLLNSSKMKGGYVMLDEPSITGTANIIMTAVRIKGKSIIYNAACEPYIQQLCIMLQEMGAKILGIGSNLLTIEGVEYLHGTQIETLPDIIEVGSFIGLAALTASDITIQGIEQSTLGVIPSTFEKLGIEIVKDKKSLHILKNERYKIQNFIDGSTLTIADGPWPMFSPDLLSIVIVTAIQASGTLLIHQKMYESRLFFVDKLIDMGARIILCDPHRAAVIGLDRSSQLRSISTFSPDIRAGIALLIATLSAKGTSFIHNIEQIDRGYENIDTRLNALGAEIQRIEE